MKTIVSENKETTNKFKDIKEMVFKSNITKTILIGIGVVGIIGLSGYLFKLLNFSIGNYKELSNTIKGK